jgi:hypothetical protein
VIRREAQMSENVLARRRRPKALHANDRTLVTRPVTPSYRRGGLHRDAFLDAWRQARRALKSCWAHPLALVAGTFGV